VFREPGCARVIVAIIVSVVVVVAFALRCRTVVVIMVDPFRGDVFQ
jgi:hypothetical protein